jgi:hypothetical protein
MANYLLHKPLSGLIECVYHVHDFLPAAARSTKIFLILVMVLAGGEQYVGASKAQRQTEA